MPIRGSRRKKPVSKKEIERRKAMFLKVPDLQKKSEDAAEKDQKEAEELLDEHLF